MESNVFEEFEQMVPKEIPYVDEGVEDFAPSMEVQAAEIREAFMDIPELQFENWQHLEVNERLDALQQLENEVAEIAHMPPCGVSMEVMDPNQSGYFDGQRIVISETLVSDPNKYYDALNTLFHEGRHAYQDYNLYSRVVVEQNAELVQSWWDNCEELGYESGDWMIFKDLGFMRYKTQPVEVDSRVYAETAMDALFPNRVALI